MTSTVDARTTPLTRNNRIGLGLAAVLGVIDVASLFLPAPGDEPGVDGPPIGIIVLGGILGLLTLGAVVKAWRTGSRGAIRLAAGLRIFSVITALPAFFVDVDAWIKVLVACLVLLATTSVVLMLSPATRRAPVLD